MLTKCKICNGKGYIVPKGLEIGVLCSACRGKGGFDVPDNKELCPDCNGRGKVVMMTNLGFGVEVNCERCFGTGLIDKTAE